MTIVLSIVALGLTLAGCDKCGFLWNQRAQSCKATGPQ
jgi:hypothetical protein